MGRYGTGGGLRGAWIESCLEREPVDRVVAPKRGAISNWAGEKRSWPLAGTWKRKALGGVAWATADATSVVQDTTTELLAKLKGGKELMPLDLRPQPDIQNLLGIVDIDELTT